MGGESLPHARSPRRDAAHNRVRLLEAARLLYSERGGRVSLHDVAAQAGVGIGTVYRNFADKDALLEQLVDERIEEVAALLEDALHDDDAWRGLAGFLDSLVRLQFADRGFKEALAEHPVTTDCPGRWGERVLTPLAGLLERAQHQGSVRPDLRVSDLIFIQAAIAALVDERAGRHEPETYRRYLALLLDGIRTGDGGRTALPTQVSR